MSDWFKKFVSTVGDLFHSKKFLVASGATMAAIAAGQPPKNAILAGGIAYVGAQGMADWGKNAPPKAP